MSTAAILIMLVSACLHLTWNMLCKSSIKDARSWMIICFLVAIISSPFLFMYKEYLPEILKYKQYFLLIGFFNSLQIWAFLVAYRFGDYTFVYPLKSALPIVFTAIYSIIIGQGGNIQPLGYLGFILIIGGCIILPIKNKYDITWKNYINKAFLFALLAGIGTSVYSTFDSFMTKSVSESLGVSSIHISLLYVPILYTSIALTLIPFILLDKYALKIKYTKINIKPLLIVTIFTSSAYTLVLFAYNMAANVSYIVAFRQVGMPLSFIVGTLFLKEKIYIGKALGVSIILAGLILTAIF